MNTVAQNNETRPSAGLATPHRRMRGSLAWESLDLSSVDSPAAVGDAIRVQAAWLATLDRQRASGGELRRIDLDEVRDTLRSVAADLDDLTERYEAGTGEHFRSGIRATVPEAAYSLGTALRDTANRISRLFRSAVHRAELHEAILSLTAISLAADDLGAWFGADGYEALSPDESGTLDTARTMATPETGIRAARSALANLTAMALFREGGVTAGQLCALAKEIDSNLANAANAFDAFVASQYHTRASNPLDAAAEE